MLYCIMTALVCFGRSGICEGGFAVPREPKPYNKNPMTEFLWRHVILRFGQTGFIPKAQVPFFGHL